MITYEKIQHHISHLRARHDHLDDQISAMEKHGHFNDIELSQLKKEKLALKDEIEMNLRKQRELQ